MSADSRLSIKCIICSKTVTGRGAKSSCKRHLDKQHVAPPVFQCKGCLSIFSFKTAATKHCKSCVDGGKGYRETTVERNLFASEFTGECFTAKDTLLEHFLELCDRPEQRRPAKSYCRKLQCLLNHQTYHEDVTSLSRTILGSPDAWTALIWDEVFANEAATTLESPNFSYRNALSSEGASNIHTILERIIRSGAIHTNINYDAPTHSNCFSLDSPYEQQFPQMTPAKDQETSASPYTIADDEYLGHLGNSNAIVTTYSSPAPGAHWSGSGPAFAAPSSGYSQLDWLPTPNMPLRSNVRSTEDRDSETLAAGDAAAHQEWQPGRELDAESAAPVQASSAKAHWKAELALQPPYTNFDHRTRGWSLFSGDEHISEES